MTVSFTLNAFAFSANVGSVPDSFQRRKLSFLEEGGVGSSAVSSVSAAGSAQQLKTADTADKSSSEAVFNMWAKQMMPSENSYNTYDTHHHNEKRFTDVLR